MANTPVTLLGLWRHSFEEDSDGIRVYRPVSVELPRARGRAGLQFEPDGTFVELGIGRGDRSAPTAGTWTAESDGSLRLGYADSARGTQRLEIVEHDASVLKVRV